MLLNFYILHGIQSKLDLLLLKIIPYWTTSSLSVMTHYSQTLLFLHFKLWSIHSLKHISNNHSKFYMSEFKVRANIS